MVTNKIGIQQSSVPKPPFWRHILAMVYDAFLIIPLLMASTALWVALLGPTSDIKQPAVPDLLQWCSWLLILVGFFGLFWRRGGQTLGMQAWRLKLVSEKELASPTWHQIALRILVAFVSFGALGIGFLWRFVNPKRLYWHDIISQTHLELMPRAER